MQCFTIFTKPQLYNNEITIVTTATFYKPFRSSLLELFYKVGAPQKYTK